MMEKKLFVLSQEPGDHELRIISADDSAAVLLLGRGVLTHPSKLGDRPVYAVLEEVEELGLESGLSPNIEKVSSADVIELIVESRVLNVG